MASNFVFPTKIRLCWVFTVRGKRRSCTKMCNAVLLTIHAEKKNRQREKKKKNKNRNKLEIDRALKTFKKKEQKTHAKKKKERLTVFDLTRS